MVFAKRILWALALVVLMNCLGTTPLQADTLSASWFSMAPNDPDAGVSQGTGSLVTTVGAGLGPNGLPVLNATGQSILHDFNATTKELEWWSPSLDSHVTVLSNPVYPATITLPFTDNNMYTNTTVLGANGNDASAFLTAKFVGNFTVSSPGAVTFNVCSDDDEFVYLSGGAFGAGTAVVDNGGIHGLSCTGPNVNTGLLTSVAAGTYTLSVFYADRQQTGAAFQLSANLDLAPPPTGVPEPSTAVSLVALGFAAVILKMTGRWPSRNARV